MKISSLSILHCLVSLSKSKLDPTVWWRGISCIAKDAAEDYERKLKALYPDVVGLPKFDFLLVGAGPDGHTCSLFPGW
jgi:6-phosphogluconolactonase/glucosamine-6-phosphate isomerase/deaminase